VVKITVLSFIILCFLMAVSPPSALSGEQSAAAAETEQDDFNLGQWLLSFYSKHISPVDGDRCPSYPSCGAYGAIAFKKHGFFIGWMMTVDRLIHEGKEEAKVSPFIFSEGKWKLYDPVENNDFWWYDQDEKDRD
jgi:hypothetical protein